MVPVYVEIQDMINTDRPSTNAMVMIMRFLDKIGVFDLIIALEAGKWISGPKNESRARSQDRPFNSAFRQLCP